jgi:sugar phosphate isomerase/epimerase
MNFAPILQTFKEIHYEGGIHVELSRHSHEGPQRAQESWDYLQRFISQPR